MYLLYMYIDNKNYWTKKVLTTNIWGNLWRPQKSSRVLCNTFKEELPKVLINLENLLYSQSFPQRILKSGLESPVDLLVGTPGTLLEFRERGMVLS